MPRLADGSVIVITGASSGIGRATAREFSRRRMRLVLASRSSAPLREVAGECRRLGGQALAVATDMTDPEQVETLRAAAVAEFGRIDVWVNCAAVLLFGGFEATPPDLFRRVLDNNVMGYVHGSQAALRQFRLQGDKGVLINVSSILGVVPEPFVSAYVSTKYAIRGLTACIRQEVRACPGIRVTTILPAAIDTPIYQKAGNLSGRKVRTVLPVYRTERAARVIVRAASWRRREIKVGGFAVILDLASRIAPSLLEPLLARVGPWLQFRSQQHPNYDGNLFEAAPPFDVSGGWRTYWAQKIAAGGKEPAELPPGA